MDYSVLIPHWLIQPMKSMNLMPLNLSQSQVMPRDQQRDCQDSCNASVGIPSKIKI